MQKPSIQHLLNNGGIGILPTDTLYGLVGQALSQAAVERIYRVKGRKPTKPLIILIGAVSDIQKFGVPRKIIQEHIKILSGLWPGKVSVILPVGKENQKKFRYLHRGTNSLAFRLPRKKNLQALLKKTGPLVAPSANPEGLTPAETVREAKKYFNDSVDFYIPGGRKKGKPSVLVSLATKKPAVLRGELPKKLISLVEKKGEVR